MADAPSLILLELNELTPSLLFRFMREGDLPNFQRFYDESHVYTTDAEASGLDLNPWIQWVTVHSGLPPSDHGVFLLGEGGKLKAPGIADIVSAAGFCVWLCGSMNVRVRTPLNGAVLPDPWAADAKPFPEELESYSRFVRHEVLEHTNPDRTLGFSDRLAFLRFMLTHGMSTSTAWAIARQLLRERRGRYGWKRVAILDRLQWDVFRYYYRRLQPHFATFFLNSVAHLQHTHWREFEPERFSLQSGPEERAEFRDAVRFGYQENDRLVGRFLDLAGRNTTLVFCTALSQQPDLRWEESGGKRFYRPRDFARLAAFADLGVPYRCAPVMSEEFWLEFESESDADKGERALRALGVNGKTALRVDRRGKSIYAGCALHGAVPSDAKLTHDVNGTFERFHALFYQAETVKSGVHHADGMLWIRLPSRTHREHPTKVPLTAIAPTLLSLMRLSPLDHMCAKPLI
jgi:hypothetical protein